MIVHELELRAILVTGCGWDVRQYTADPKLIAVFSATVAPLRIITKEGVS